ncbi:glycosyltransferase [Mucilaginibacter limnophilus]|uniref:Glycosyltransferase n=1 Tax=Mucilaginibacter limnophilus TaxID=1932778 RepID=A0A437MW77_9SPHI|nr:polysaccharide deacetylase family protein [Mucilaginibacter limnophilus]RVU01866.1 glycosyltransferase [Mucilaginibacter limnophilus]
MSGKQVFQADTPNRWKRFKWFSRIFFLILISGLIAAAVTVTDNRYPVLPNLNPSPKKLTKEQLEQLKRSTKFRDFKIQKVQIQKLQEARRQQMLKHAVGKRGINAAFYRAWEPQAYTSLADNYQKLDMIVCEGFFIKPGSYTVNTAIDTGIINLNKKYKKQVIVSLSNYVNYNNVSGGFDTETTRKIIASAELRKGFINSIVIQLKKYRFNGINLDMYELDHNDPNFIAFQKELYATLHANKLLATHNVIADDEQYNVEQLQKYNDYLFLMAIDQHNQSSNEGDVSHQDWVEIILDNVCSKVPSEKVILVVAGGGYDWPKNSVGVPVGYQQAISVAKENNSKIIFDPASANLHYRYTGTDSLEHNVYFADAATNFNLMRMADDWGTAGVAVWRLGFEDPRIWTFIHHNLTIDSLKENGFDTKKMATVGLNNKIDYIGDGEVLDLITRPHPGKITIKLDTSDYSIIDQNYVELPTKYVIRRYGYAPKKVVLTFDDGPDPNYTPRILDILKEENVPATFFVVGSMVEKNIPILKRIYDEGYEIGNHTYLHPDISQVSLQRVNLELNATRKLIESITGRSTILFRPPFNADAEPQTIAEVIPVEESRKQSYINIGESIDPWDWQPGVTADSIYERTIRLADKGSMILLHDAGGDTREPTVQALPRIIKELKRRGYKFTTIADVLGKSKDELMPVVKDDVNSGLTGGLYDAVVTGYFYFNWFLFYVFLTAIFLALARIVLIGLLAIRQFIENKDRQEAIKLEELPHVSIIVPAYNEEVTAVKTINSLLQLDYPDFDIIFVDDGSKDKTFEVVKAAYGEHPLVKIFTKPNGGKASALNYGINHTESEFVVCIDADTQLKNDAIYHLMTCFTDEEIGAVAGTVKVGNEINFITRWQSIEYITAQNMDRRAFDLINSITVVPGAIGAFRKSAINAAGGFTYDTLAEDCDLTMRILKQGYVVRNCGDAIAYTEAPETVNALLKQRFRWSFGVIQSFWKNKDALFNKKYKFFGMVGMPNILIFQIILPLFSPIADLMMIISLFGPHPERLLNYYLVFLLVDFIVSMIAFRMEKEDYRKLVYIIPQRFIWRQLMYFVLFKSIRKALKGELSSWGTLKRTGNVKL